MLCWYYSRKTFSCILTLTVAICWYAIVFLIADIATFCSCLCLLPQGWCLHKLPAPEPCGCRRCGRARTQRRERRSGSGRRGETRKKCECQREREREGKLCICFTVKFWSLYDTFKKNLISSLSSQGKPGLPGVLGPVGPKGSKVDFYLFCSSDTAALSVD